MHEMTRQLKAAVAACMGMLMMIGTAGCIEGLDLNSLLNQLLTSGILNVDQQQGESNSNDGSNTGSDGSNDAFDDGSGDNSTDDSGNDSGGDVSNDSGDDSSNDSGDDSGSNGQTDDGGQTGGQTGDATAGQALFQANGCMGCHGADGSGPPNIRGQSASSIFNRLSGAVSHPGGTVSGITQADAEDLAAFLSQ